MKTGDLVVILVIALVIVMSIKNCNEKIALDECIDDISNRCPRVYNYALALENENNRLYKSLKKCKKLK